jgi:hypothetical protein
MEVGKKVLFFATILISFLSLFLKKKIRFILKDDTFISPMSQIGLKKWLYYDFFYSARFYAGAKNTLYFFTT